MGIVKGSNGLKGCFVRIRSGGDAHAVAARAQPRRGAPAGAQHALERRAAVPRGAPHRRRRDAAHHLQRVAAPRPRRAGPTGDLVLSGFTVFLLDTVSLDLSAISGLI